MTRNLTLWSDESVVAARASFHADSVARCWCDPRAFSDVVGLDFGSGRMHLYSTATGRAWDVDAASAKNQILSLPRNTLVIAEPAHLATPRTRKSLAQPFTSGDLLDIYRSAASAEITLKMFPHYHTGTRARAWVSAKFPELNLGEKTDAGDAMSLALYVVHCNGVSLANPPASFAVHPLRQYGMAVRQYSNIALNAERTNEYSGLYMKAVIQLGDEIFRRRGKRIGKTGCYSIASVIVTEIDAEPLMFALSNGSILGVSSWWRYVARMTPFHHRGGIARSNLMRHAFPPFLRKVGRRENVNMGTKKEFVPFGAHDDQQAATRTRAMKEFRGVVKDCYRVGVKAAVRLGYRKFDPVANPVHGGH